MSCMEFVKRRISLMLNVNETVTDGILKILTVFRFEINEGF